MSIALKACNWCGTVYPGTAEFFGRTKNTKSGLVGHCKKCHAKRMREWQRQNRDKVRAYSQKARDANPERVRQYARDYRKRQREKVERMEQSLAEKERYIAKLEALVEDA